MKRRLTVQYIPEETDDPAELKKFKDHSIEPDEMIVSYLRGGSHIYRTGDSEKPISYIPDEGMQIEITCFMGSQFRGPAQEFVNDATANKILELDHQFHIVHQDKMTDKDCQQPYLKTLRELVEGGRVKR